MQHKNVLKKISLQNGADTTFETFTPLSRRVYELTPTLVVDLRLVTKMLIIPGAENIRYVVKKEWEYIRFHYDNRSRYFAFKKKFGECAYFKTNCKPYLLQDVLHSLHSLPADSGLPSDLLDQIIAALSSTPYGIRSLGQQDKNYRIEQRRLYQETQNMTDPKLIETRQFYRTLPYVRVQMSMSQLHFKSHNEDERYLGDVSRSSYSQSLPEDVHSAIRKMNSSRGFSSTMLVESTKNEYYNRLQEAMEGNLHDVKFLDVGCGNGENLLFFTSSQRMKVYGIDPHVEMSTLCRTALKISAANYAMKPENFFKESAQSFTKRSKFRGYFDVVMISLFDIPLQERDEFFKAITLLCKPNAKVIITCSTIEYADPQAKLDRNSVVPHLFSHFNEISRGEYSEKYTKHRFLFVCEKPRLTYTNKSLPHAKVCGSIQRYYVTQWDDTKAALVLRLNGSYEIDEHHERAAYVMLPSILLKSKEDGGYREDFELGRSRLRKDVGEDKMIHLKRQYAGIVTIEVGADSTAYMITYPSEYKKSLELFFQSSATMDKNVVTSPQFMRGIITPLNEGKKELTEAPRSEVVVKNNPTNQQVGRR